MHRLKSYQKDRAKEFIALTQSGEKTAIDCLNRNEWRLDLALDFFFQNPYMFQQESKHSHVDRSKIETLFSKYKDRNTGDKIGKEGVIRLYSISLCAYRDMRWHSFTFTKNSRTFKRK